MHKNRSLKQRLLAVVLVMVMLVSSLLGTTFAWFTDNVTSGGNKIESGSLKIDLWHKYEDEWVSLKDYPDHLVFDYDNWEPGYTTLETLKVVNMGSLALQYKLSVERAVGTETFGDNGEDLADVIDVYVTYGERDVASYDEISTSSDWLYKGTLAEAMEDPSSFIGGQLLPTGEVKDENSTAAVGEQVVMIALHMQEDAGNAYQETAVGDIYVNLIATQWGYEEDSFGPDYDASATFPQLNLGGLNIPVSTENGYTTAAADVAGEGVSASVPAGVAVEDGISALNLSVTEKTQSEANLTLGEGEALRSLDVHMAGVSKNNTVPMYIKIEKALVVGLNIGNYTLYHVEDGTPVAMTSVGTLEELDAHNEFYYDPTTGDVTLAMATFSEVAMVAEIENAWNGEIAESFALGTGTEADPYIVANADQLAYFGAVVGGMVEDENGKNFDG